MSDNDYAGMKKPLSKCDLPEVAGSLLKRNNSAEVYITFRSSLIEILQFKEFGEVLIIPERSIDDSRKHYDLQCSQEIPSDSAAKCGAVVSLLSTDLGLITIIQAWPTLPEVIRGAMLSIVASVVAPEARHTTITTSANQLDSRNHVV